MYCAICFLCFACALVTGNTSDQGAEQPIPRVVVSETAMATCYEANSSTVAGSMLVRRPILLSPDRQNQAYAEIAAVAHGPLGQCANTTKLFVRRRGNKEFHLVYRQDPSEYELFNDIKIVDWSPDSRYLLAELGIGQWGSDFGGSTHLLYDAKSGAITPEEWLTKPFARHFGRKCLDLIESKGFADSGCVVLRIRPVKDEEGILDPESCVKKEQFLLIDPATHAISSLAGKYSVKRYGRLLDKQPNK